MLQAAEPLSSVRGLFPATPGRGDTPSGSSPGLSISPALRRPSSSGGSAAAVATSASCGASLDLVAAALEQDLEVERRERREQVGFLNRVGAQEREVLQGRMDAVERRHAEARELWERERRLLKERLLAAEQGSAREAEASLERVQQSAEMAEARLEVERRRAEADAARWSDGAEELGARVSCLEIERDLARQEFQAAGARGSQAESTAQDLERRLIASEGERSVLALELSEARETIVGGAVQEAQALEQLREESSLQARALEASVAAVQQELQQLQAQGELELRRAHEEADERVAESQEEGQEAFMRALWQIQQADECMQAFRQRREQDFTAEQASRLELSELRLRSQEESATCEELAAALAASESEKQVLQRRVHALEESLRAEAAGGREALASAARERREALARLEQLRVVRERSNSIVSSQADCWPGRGPGQVEGRSRAWTSALPSYGFDDHAEKVEGRSRAWTSALPSDGFDDHGARSRAWTSSLPSHGFDDRPD
mmetsp:Transcript_129822/g.277101  ORF Transcript_129822/g.277101 Transcript_129822/m.277101 type:complete len:500 (-) Transcript_129822:74-1573(-)